MNVNIRFVSSFCDFVAINFIKFDKTQLFKVENDCVKLKEKFGKTYWFNGGILIDYKTYNYIDFLVDFKVMKEEDKEKF